ncbi:class I SAM-dependent methyltransferase [Arthrobacter sp. B3I4]|uniref:class I SAM-dependent methyltransferase n=1 Tax=Arthrobacter sp. B3I4 TaxID=3042267 RepID=UPI0027849110|nr:class I SAM-dependent methyltransferase [Arthrobacter sp. B3I4]MDQ0757244.1 SAM-dependent methyltransferase [Arthrobacter sp. B3I4]
MTSPRTDQLADFVALLKAEGRRSVLGVDCGTGADGLLVVRAGLHFTGVDASEENIHAARARGLSASVATGRSLPFADGAFTAVWAVDALAELPAGARNDVVRELRRVAEPGAPIAVVLPEPGLVPEDPGLGPGFAVLRTPA